MTCVYDGIKRVEGARRFCQEYVGPTHVTLYVTERPSAVNRVLTKEKAIKEVVNLPRLNHSHIIQIIGTYTMGNELLILMYLVTEYDLHSFMLD
jgi:hypothetical protein